MMTIGLTSKTDKIEFLENIKNVEPFCNYLEVIEAQIQKGDMIDG